MKVLLLLFAFTGHYLLMQPIEYSIKSGDFSQFRDISKKKISIHCEPPFELKGYLFIDKFIQDFSAKYSRYKSEKTEWSSKQFEDNFAVQSL
ncbi:MAG: hypothetical protein GY757_44750, partial [bacterium]|nr:hypothetical protein [bacterium]